MSAKLKNVLAGLSGLVLLTLAAAYCFGLPYQYSHVPVRSVIIPRDYLRMGQGVDGLAFSPPGDRLAVADTQSSLSLWDLPQLHCGPRLKQTVGQEASTLCWTPDGSILAAGDSGTAYRWNVRLDKLAVLPTKQVGFTRKADKKEYWNIFQFTTVSPSGKLAASADTEGDIVAWDVQTGRQLFFANALPPGEYGYAMHICDIAFSHDDRFMAVSSLNGDARTALAPLDIVIHDLQTGHIARRWQWKEAYLMMIDDTCGGNLADTGLTFSSDGKMLAAADITHTAIWNTQTGQLQRILEATGANWGGIKKLVFFNNNRWLTGCGWGDHVPVWNIATGKLVQTFYADADTGAVAVSSDNHWLATGGANKNNDGKIELWDIGRLLH